MIKAVQAQPPKTTNNSEGYNTEKQAALLSLRLACLLKGAPCPPAPPQPFIRRRGCLGVCPSALASCGTSVPRSLYTSRSSVHETRLWKSYLTGSAPSHSHVSAQHVINTQKRKLMLFPSPLLPPSTALSALLYFFPTSNLDTLHLI